MSNQCYYVDCHNELKIMCQVCNQPVCVQHVRYNYQIHYNVEGVITYPVICTKCQISTLNSYKIACPCIIL